MRGRETRSDVPEMLGIRGTPTGVLGVLLLFLHACNSPFSSQPIPDDDSTVSDDDATASDDDATASDDDATASDDDATAGDDDATASDDDATADDDATSVSDDDATASDDDTSVSDDDATVSDDDTSVSDDDATVSDDDTTPLPSCGDDTCSADESCWSCASDCGACDCPNDVAVVIYTQSAWNVLADAFLADPSPCADYGISLPALSDNKTWPRGGGEPEKMRARGPRFHAMAEFHWSTWEDEAGSWYDKGVEFRSRMESEGYDVEAGDTWAINELPSTVRSDDSVRADVEEVMEGLFDGPSGSVPAQGAVFTVGMGQSTVNFSVYEPYLKDWLEDAGFWGKANLYARFWAQEVYSDPSYVCVPDTTTAERSAATNAYVEHVARLAEVGPDSANTAQTYMGRAYTPLMNAVWNSADSGYGDTVISLEQMQHFVSGEVYAARAWSGDHSYPDGRLGFAWARVGDVSDDDLGELATRLAQSIRYAYDEGGGSAAHACSPSGAYTFCQCSVSGATFNSGWEDTFSSW